MLGEYAGPMPPVDADLDAVAGRPLINPREFLVSDRMHRVRTLLDDPRISRVEGDPEPKRTPAPGYAAISEVHPEQVAIRVGIELSEIDVARRDVINPISKWPSPSGY